jgi:hypothetical protein
VVVDVLSSSLPASVSKCRGGPHPEWLSAGCRDSSKRLCRATCAISASRSVPLVRPRPFHSIATPLGSGRDGRPDASRGLSHRPQLGRIGSAVLETNGTARKDSSRKKAPATAGDQFRHSVSRRRGAGGCCTSRARTRRRVVAHPGADVPDRGDEWAKTGRVDRLAVARPRLACGARAGAPVLRAR